MKILLLIYTCKKYSFLHNDYKNKYTSLGYDFYLVYCDPNIDEDCIIDQENSSFILKCEDNFENLPKKTYLMLKTFLECESFNDYDYIIKMDDDTEINFKLSELVNSNLLDGDYIGAKLLSSEPQDHNYHFGKCSNNELNSTPYKLDIDLSWGAGYFYILSRKAIKIRCDDIEGYKQLLADNLYEDMMIGYILFNNDIEFKELFNKSVITNLSRPRRLSINILNSSILNNNNINKVTYNSRVNKIKKITTYTINKNSQNCIDDVDDKLQKELHMNTELNKRISELSKQIENNKIKEEILQTEIKKPLAINPVIQRNLKKVVKVVNRDAKIIKPSIRRK